MRKLILFTLPAVLSGCQAISTENPIADDRAVGQLATGSPEWRGWNFARNRCSDCHAVENGQTSSMSSAPTFAAVVNTPGLTKPTLNRWLRTHGDHPREMYFEIPAEHIDDLVAYMLTLRAEPITPS